MINLLMILLVLLAIWVGAAVCYFAWKVMPDVPKPDDDKDSDDPSAGEY